MRKLILAAAFMTIGTAYAQQPAPAPPLVVNVVKDVVNVGQGGQVILQTLRPFSQVTVADPEVADALPRSDRILVVVGKKLGSSDITLFGDEKVINHVTVQVIGSPVVGKVLAHNKRGDLNSFTAFQCNPVCSRIEDKFENKAPDVIMLGPTGPMATSSTNIILPPAPPR